MNTRKALFLANWNLRCVQTGILERVILEDMKFISTDTSTAGNQYEQLSHADPIHFYFETEGCGKHY